VCDNDFDFFQDLEVRDITKLKIVSVNHVGCNDKISDTNVGERMKFLNLKKKNKELVELVTKFPNWQFDIATSAMIKMRFMYEPEELRNTKEITFKERLCTFVITQLRKSLNKYGKNGIPGYKLARVRTSEHASIKGKSSNYIWPEYIKCWEVSNIVSGCFLSLL
jgi:hypothetical protein